MERTRSLGNEIISLIQGTNRIILEKNLMFQEKEVAERESCIKKKLAEPPNEVP